MTDNIKSKHYRTGEIDIYEAQYLVYPFEQYRAIMQASAEHHIHMSSGNRVENLEEAIYILERLKEKEIEHDRYNHVKTNYGELLEKGNIATEWNPAPEEVLGQADFQTLEEGLDNPKLFIRDIDASNSSQNQKDNRNIRLLNSFLDSGYNYLARDENGNLWKYQSIPKRNVSFWNESSFEDAPCKIDGHDFPEVKWTDGKPTRIIDLLETYSKSEAPNAGQYLDDVYHYHDDLLKRLRSDDYDYLARDEDGDLWGFREKPKKEDDFWDTETDYRSTIIESDDFPEIKWTDDEPTEIADLLLKFEKEEFNNG